jgi:hypothetical protein
MQPRSTHDDTVSHVDSRSYMSGVLHCMPCSCAADDIHQLGQQGAAVPILQRSEQPELATRPTECFGRAPALAAQAGWQAGSGRPLLSWPSGARTAVGCPGRVRG